MGVDEAGVECYALKHENVRCVDKTSSVYTQANVT